MQVIDGALTFASYDTLEGNAYATTGLSKTLAVDFSLAGRWQADGYGRNITTGKRNSFEDYASGRIKLLWEPSASTKVRASMLRAWNYLSVEGNTYPGTTAGYESLPLPTEPFTTIGFYDTRFDTDSYAKAKVTAANVKIDQELSFASLASISAWSRDGGAGCRRPRLQRAARRDLPVSGAYLFMDPGTEAEFEGANAPELGGWPVLLQFSVNL